MKNSIRREIKNRLLELDCRGKKEASEKIFATLTSSPCFQNANSIFVYYSTEIEVDTKEIIKLALSLNKTVAIPKLDEGMRAVKINRNSSFVKNEFGILEPIDNDELKKIDLCIAPVVAFDRNKTRLGHGKGYYDRFLEKHNCNKIALAFSCQEVQLIPKHYNDINMNMIITEKEIIK